MLTTFLNKDWKEILGSEFEKDYFIDLSNFLNEEYSNKDIFPPKNEIFRAFNICSFTDTKVVILGQDPYHNFDQANGLAFSVKENQKIPPSLRNIYKELHDDKDIILDEDSPCNASFGRPAHGCLDYWAKQGVLLLNTTLTVEAHKAGSHQKRGWEVFTNEVIKTISEKKNNVVFILWGSPAQRKESLINSEKHLILKSAHPSPLSAYRGFFGNKHFSTCNTYLIDKGLSTISW